MGGWGTNAVFEGLAGELMGEIVEVKRLARRYMRLLILFEESEVGFPRLVTEFEVPAGGFTGVVVEVEGQRVGFTFLVVVFEGPAVVYPRIVGVFEGPAVGFTLLLLELPGQYGGQTGRNTRLIMFGSTFSTISATSRNGIFPGRPPFSTASVHVL